MSVEREESWDSLTFIDPNSEEEPAKVTEKKKQVDKRQTSRGWCPRRHMKHMHQG